MPRKLHRTLRPDESKSRAKNKKWTTLDSASELSAAAIGVVAVVAGEAVVVDLNHVASETRADLPHDGGRRLPEVAPATLTRMPHAAVAELDRTVVVALDRGLRLDLSPAHHHAEDVATARKSDPLPHHGPQVHRGVGEIQELVTDLLDHPPVQIHHAHEHPEDAAIPVVRLLKAGAEAPRGAEGVHIQAQGQDLGLGYEVADAVTDAETAVGGDHPRTHLTIESRQGLILLGAAPAEMIAV